MTKRGIVLTSMMVGVLAAMSLGFPRSLAAHGPGGHGEPHKERKKVPLATVSGEVLSLPCYLKHGASGKSYEKCSESALAMKYISAALMTSDGTLYFLVMDHEDAFKAVRKLVSMEAVAKGRAVKQGDVRGLVLQSIKRVETKKE